MKSRMTRERHVRFCESLGVKLPGATRPPTTLVSVGDSERQNRPLTAFAPDLEHSATDIEAIVPVWRELFGRVDTKAGRDSIRRRSRSQPCHERHSALAFNH